MDQNDALTASMLARVARALVICDRNGDCDYQAAAAAADRIPDPVLREKALRELARIEDLVEDLVALAPAVRTGHGARAVDAVPRFARALVAALPVPVAAPAPAPEPAPVPAAVPEPAPVPAPVPAPKKAAPKRARKS